MTAIVEAFDPLHFRARGWWRDETLRDWLARCVGRDAQKTAIAASGTGLTYFELNQQVHSFAAALQEQGIGHGDIVAVHLPNIPAFLISWLAINDLGAVMQTVHTLYGVRELEQLLKHSGAKACIALAQTKGRSPAQDAARLRDALPALKLVIAVSGEVPATVNFEQLLAGSGDNNFRSPAVAATDQFLQLYTSGTTSSPKAVSVTYNQFLSNARMCAAEFGITASDRILCLAPFTHLYGLYALQLGFSAGATACLLDVFSPPGFVQALKEFNPTMLFAGPAHVSPCLQQRMLDNIDFSAMRIAVLSGTTVPAALSAALEEKLPNGKVLQAWGMTELQFGACSRPADSTDVRFNSIGRATPGTELRAADAGGNLFARGDTGELQVRGCSLFSAYAGNEEATRASFTPDGWFRTGDLASMDAEGNVRLAGRIKELINRGGIKFNPIEMEVAISAHPAVAQVAIAPLPDPVLGERAACFVVLKSGATFSFEDLKNYLAQRKFAKFTWPENFAIVTDMPMTPTRKVMKAELVEQYLASTTRTQQGE